MDCREFRSKHVAFVDDLLPAVEMDAMQQHVTICSRCSRHNTAIRRSLMLVRSLPSIEPSPDFIARLNARLEEMGPVSRVDLVAPRPYLPSLSAFAALAAGPRSPAIRTPRSSHAPRIGFQDSHPTRTRVRSASAIRPAAARASRPGATATETINSAATTASPRAIRRRRTALV